MALRKGAHAPSVTHLGDGGGLACRLLGARGSAHVARLLASGLCRLRKNHYLGCLSLAKLRSYTALHIISEDIVAVVIGEELIAYFELRSKS